MRCLSLILVSAVALAGTTGAAQSRWNPRAPENSQVLPSFSHASVEPVLRTIGAQYQRTGSGFNVTFPNGRKAVLSFGSCLSNGASCKALSMQASWTRIANSPPERTEEAIQRFNQRYSFAKAYLTAEGQPGMQRYLTADYGFIRGNLAVNLLVFADQVNRFATTVLRPLETRQ